MIPTTQKALRHTRILKDGIPFSPKEFKICKCVISIRLLQVCFLSTIFLRFAIPICSLLPKIWRGECVRGRNYTIFTKYNCFLYYPWTITVLIICKKKNFEVLFSSWVQFEEENVLVFSSSEMCSFQFAFFSICHSDTLYLKSDKKRNTLFHSQNSSNTLVFYTCCLIYFAYNLKNSPFWIIITCKLTFNCYDLRSSITFGNNFYLGSCRWYLFSVIKQ